MRRSVVQPLDVSRILALALVVTLCVPVGCRDAPKSTAADAGGFSVPEPMTVRPDNPSLLFSYRREDGTYATATRVDEVPEAARERVVVMDLDKTPEERRAGRYIHVADLRKPGDDGTYPVAVQSRYAFEVPAETSPAGPSTSNAVIVYSASWCGVCKKTKRLLSEWKVPFIEKDIEASRAAAGELAAKAAERGFAPSGVPVIDVRGVLLRGLDEARLKATLQQQGLLSSL